MSLTKIQRKIDVLRGKKETIEANIEEMQGQIYIAKKRKANVAKCMQLLEYLSNMNQNKILGLFEHTVSCGLKDLFDDSYKFQFEMKTRGSSSACDFQIQCSAFPGWSNIVMCHGKSLEEIVGTIFRIILIKLDKGSRNIVILDEPMSGVELERQPLAIKFLDEISSKFNMQIILVSHSEEFIAHADKEIRTHG
jgi:ABC-type dipeptide/oligopeptide/nickel transport system ATPase component